MSATTIPRFSTMTMALAPAISFATSATTACFCSRFRLKVYLRLFGRRRHRRSSHPPPANAGRLLR